MAPSGTADRGKEAAGIQAAEAIQPGMILGLGTGSTVAFFLKALGDRFNSGELPGIVGVPTSLRTEIYARDLGIPLTTLEAAGTLDVTVDGADEVDPNLDLIKGLGGALLREKMVAQMTHHLVIIVDHGKMVERLGTQSPVPVEVVPFGWGSHIPYLEELGIRPLLREGPEGCPYMTDNGNYILDCHFQDGILNSAAMDEVFQRRAGLVESGLFLGMAQEVYIGGEEGVTRLLRK